MDPEPTEFAALRRLLAFKRHEVPPPGFFDRLPDQIHGRLELEASEVGRAWWVRLRESLAWRPTLAGAVALGVVSVVLWRAMESQPPTHHLAPILAQDHSSLLVGIPVRLDPPPSLSFTAHPFESESDAEQPSLSVYTGTPAPEGLFRPWIGGGLRSASFPPALTNVLGR